MKKFLLLILLFASVNIAFSQTIVSTEPAAKNVVLEEFTGIHCVYCPDGHAIAQALQNNYPGRVFLINVHEGTYSTPGTGEPDFRTNFGTLLRNQTGLTGYPAATVNRHLFSGLSQGSGTAMNRDRWSYASSLIMAADAPVNVAVEAQIDVQTRELTVHVEAYYTADAANATNFMNVALLQNNTLGPQVGGDMGNEYVHMHRLVHLVTGQWGEEIATTTAGTFVDKTYTYTIPDVFRNVEAVIADMEIVAFITETRQEITNGNGCYPTFTNYAHQNDVSIIDVKAPETICTPEVAPEITVENTGENAIESLEIHISVNGEAMAEPYIWTETIEPLQRATIQLPMHTFSTSDLYDLQITLGNDENLENNTMTTAIALSQEATTTVNLDIHTDAYPDEMSWRVKDSDGNILFSSPNYSGGTAIQVTETFDLPDGCYTFEVEDSYGDGINYQVTNAHLYLTDSEGLVLMSYPTGAIGLGDVVNFSTKTLTGLAKTSSDKIQVYPNPAQNTIFIKNENKAHVELFDMSGKCLTSTHENQLDISNFANGIYFLKISDSKSTQTHKISIEK